MFNDSYDSPQSNNSQQQENNNLNTNEASSNIPTNDMIDNNNNSNSNNIPSDNNIHTGAPFNISKNELNSYHYLFRVLVLIIWCLSKFWIV